MNVEQSRGKNPEFPQADWERTPLSVKQWVESREERLGHLEQELAELKKQLAELQAHKELLLELQNRTSANSSIPPSKNPPSAPKQHRRRS